MLDIFTLTGDVTPPRFSPRITIWSPAALYGLGRDEEIDGFAKFFSQLPADKFHNFFGVPVFICVVDQKLK